MIMRSKETEKAIANLTAFLEPRHPSSVLQFIASTLIGWTHFDKSNLPGKPEIDIAWDKYFNFLRNSLDERLSLLSSPDLEMKEGRKVLPIPPLVYEKKRLEEVVALMASMPPDEALDFLAEVTANWCFSIPLNFLPIVPDGIPEKTDKAIADAIHTWFVRYYDLWH